VTATGQKNYGIAMINAIQASNSHHIENNSYLTSNRPY